MVRKIEMDKTFTGEKKKSIKHISRFKKLSEKKENKYMFPLWK